MIKNLLKNRAITNKYSNTISQINQIESDLNNVTLDDLKEKTFKLKQKYKNENNLDTILPEAFAYVRKASQQKLGLRHFDVQLMGGLVLNEGNIAEMKTGEGKTLVSTLPAYLNALTEKGVHIVTVNDYLANRDQNWMGQIHRSLGLSVGLIQENMNSKQRQKNYNADITYITNSELGFDYLRDNMASRQSELVQRPFNYCIIDEVDSILIDEARTPLIISGPTKTSIDKYIVAAEIVKYLEVKTHFEIDEKNKNIILTEQGIKQLEILLNIQDLYNKEDPWIPFVINALKALTLFFRNDQYLLKNNEILIIDEFTGRIMPDRRWSGGLHQAIEAKENVPIKSSNETLASITYQNFFLLYPKLSGMTGTGKTDEKEFEKIYNLSVTEIPTAKENKRIDLPDLIYKDELSKWKAIAKECKEVNLTGQPILIGTTSVEKSEILAKLLDDYSLSYKLLNAKPENVKKEAEIVAQAGKKGSITIATNMAGRGTDIILGGNLKFEIQKELYNYLLSIKQQKHIIDNQTEIGKLIFNNENNLRNLIENLLIDPQFLKLNSLSLLKALNNIQQLNLQEDSLSRDLKLIFNNILIILEKKQKSDKKLIYSLGGLYIIGTERNESSRIDDQLRGRCGRQGDPGKSRFFLSFDDSILRLYSDKNVDNILANEANPNIPIESRLLTKGLEIAQKRLENRNYDSRKYLFDYDEVLNKQRRVIFYERRLVLESSSVRTKIMALGEQVVSDLIFENNIENINELNTKFELLFNTSLDLKRLNELKFDNYELREYLKKQFWLIYELKETEIEIIEIGLMRQLERAAILKYIDLIWKIHLDKMSLLRDAVGWRSYGQRNPLFEYKDEAYTLFLYSSKLIRQLVIYELLNVKPI